MACTEKVYGKELIDWAIRQAETTHKGKIAVIVGDRYANKHPGDGDGLAPNFFIPAVPEGEAAAMTFVIGDVGYDYWALSWERLSSIADLEETIACILADGELVWAASAADEKRFYALRDRLNKNLSDPMYVCRVIARYLEDAMEIFKHMAFEEELGRLRVGARFIGIYLGGAIAAANGTYLKRREIGTDDPIGTLKTLARLPQGYLELQEKLPLATDGGTLLALCREMILKVRAFLKAMLPQGAEPSAKYPAGWYEEMTYTWRRIRYFCKLGDAANAFSWGAYLQADMEVLDGIVTEEERNILGQFDAGNLTHFAQVCENTRILVRERLLARGENLREYDTLEDFLRENDTHEV